MKKIALMIVSAAVSGGAAANITAFTAPVATTGGFSSASFTASTANGSYSAGFGSFDNHWLLTVDGSTPAVSVTVENSFNPGSGGGALSFDTLSFTGPGLATTALTPASPPCVPGPGPTNCIRRFIGNFATTAGTYDLRVSGGNPFNGSYSVAIQAIPEPATAALVGAGLLLLLGRRRVAARVTNNAGPTVAPTPQHEQPRRHHPQPPEQRRSRTAAARA